MAFGDTHVFPGFFTPVLTQLFFPKPPTTFSTCFCRGEGWKYAGKKSRLNRGSNLQPPGHESDALTTEPPKRGNDTDARVTEKYSLKQKWQNILLKFKKCINANHVNDKKGYLTFWHTTSVEMLKAQSGEQKEFMSELGQFPEQSNSPSHSFVPSQTIRL